MNCPYGTLSLSTITKPCAATDHDTCTSMVSHARVSLSRTFTPLRPSVHALTRPSGERGYEARKAVTGLSWAAW